MRIDLGILIGNRTFKSASKTIELDFAPTVGMNYNDGTWKVRDGINIIAVSIECEPDEIPYLAVTLERDESDTAESLTPTYESWGWKVS